MSRGVTFGFQTTLTYLITVHGHYGQTDRQITMPIPRYACASRGKNCSQKVHRNGGRAVISNNVALFTQRGKLGKKSSKINLKIFERKIAKNIPIKNDIVAEN